MPQLEIYAYVVIGIGLFFQLISVLSAYRIFKGLRWVRAQVLNFPKSYTIDLAASEYDFRSLLADVACDDWSKVQLGWNEIALAMDAFRARISIFRRALPRIHIFSAFASAALCWLGSKS